jgi:hypothetical protein
MTLTDKILVAVFTVLFYGRLREMPELSLAAKKFGSPLKHHILAWPKRGLPNF